MRTDLRSLTTTKGSARTPQFDYNYGLCSYYTVWLQQRTLLVLNSSTATTGLCRSTQFDYNYRALLDLHSLTATASARTPLFHCNYGLCSNSTVWQQLRPLLVLLCFTITTGSARSPQFDNNYGLCSYFSVSLYTVTTASARTPQFVYNYDLCFNV